MAQSKFSQAPKFWEKRGVLARLLWPVSKLFELLSALRKALYDLHLLKSTGLEVPLVIVGNLRVGGTGKTPSVLAIAKTLKAHGFHPGIISRGYLATQASAEAIEVTAQSLPSECGDEPCYMAQQLSHEAIPIFVHSKRVLAAKTLLDKHPQVDVIICDDGLQHYALRRWPAREGGHDIELVVRDARGEGNEYLLPAGPLREPADRSRDFTLNLGVLTPSAPYWKDAPNFDLTIQTGLIYQLQAPSRQMNLSGLQDLIANAKTHSNESSKLLVAAGMGNPQKFFDLLAKTGLSFESMPLPDHYDFVMNPFEQSTAEVILITEKDAVKCAQMPQYQQDPRIWVLPVTVTLPEDFVSQMVDILRRPQP